MRKTALAVALCLWTGAAFAGQGTVTSVGLTPITIVGSAGSHASVVATPSVPVESVNIAGRDLAKQLDAIQTQLKCIWLRATWSMYSDALVKCDEAFKNVNPK